MPSNKCFPHCLILIALSMSLTACDSAPTAAPPPPNPVPTITAILPNSTPDGGAAFTLTVNGSGFVKNSVVRWNASDRLTAFQNSTQLTAQISASDIAAVGAASVTVFSTAPGGGTSSALTFTITPTVLPEARVVERVSVASDGTQSDKTDIEVSSVSADGRFVAFQSIATNLVANDTNGWGDVFVRDTCLGAPVGCAASTIRVSVANDGSQANPGSLLFSFRPSISADGRFVAFEWESNLGANDNNFGMDVFVRDTCQGARIACTPTTYLASLANDGSQGDDWSFDPSLSSDGRFIAFGSYATNLVPGDTNNQTDVFRRDTCLGASTGCTPSTVRVSVASDGTQALNDFSLNPVVNADGRFVAFESAAGNLVANDTNAAIDIFVRDTCQGVPVGCTPSTTRVSVASDGSQANNHSFFPALSADGRFVAFQSDANNLVAGDTNAASDIFVRDTCQGVPAGCTPSTTRVSVASDGNQANSQSFSASLSADGRLVAFSSDASNLVVNDTNGSRDVFVRDTCQGAPNGCTPNTVRVSMASDGSQGNGGSFLPFISADGRFVTLESEASNLVPGDTNGMRDVFLAVTGFVGTAVNTSVPDRMLRAAPSATRRDLNDEGRLIRNRAPQRFF
jgi:Tol biopolymer transport system component